MISPLTYEQKAILCDPQTSGGLLVAVELQAVEKIQQIADAMNVPLFRVGRLLEIDENRPLIEIH